jgi:hypothetical protein
MRRNGRNVDYLTLTPEVIRLINEADHKPLMDHIQRLFGVPVAHDLERWKLMLVEELRTRPRTQWLIPEDEVLVSGATNLLIGETMTFKSFLALDWGMKVVREGGRVIFLLNEASETFPGRLDAWCEYHGTPDFLTENLYVFDDDFNLVTDAEDIAIMCEGAQLIVVDTLRRSIQGYAEDSADEVTDVIAACDHITRHTDAALLLVAHTGHEIKNRVRGSSVWAQAVHHAVALEKTESDGIVKMTNTKGKGRLWPVRSLKLFVTGPGEDEAVLIPTENRFTGLKLKNDRDRQLQLWNRKGNDKFTAKVAADTWKVTEERARAILREGTPLRYKTLTEGKKGQPSWYSVEDPKKSDIFEVEQRA